MICLVFIDIPLSVSGQLGSHQHKTNNEIAFIPGLAYDLGEKGARYVVHGHYLTSSDEMSDKVSVGVSLEYLWGGDSHLTAGPVVSFKPVGELIVLYSMGITIKRETSSTEYFFSNHFEIAYEFEIGEQFHIGPSAGFSVSGYDNHFSVGLHTGFAF